MMQANSLFTVLTAGDADDYTGDTPEVPTATGVPGTLIERGRTIIDPVTGAPRVVRDITIKLPWDTDVTNDERVQDEDTERIYPIREVHQYKSGGRVTEKILICADLSNTPV